MCVTNVELTGGHPLSSLGLDRYELSPGKGWVNRTTAGVNFDQDDFAIFRLSFDVSEDYCFRCLLLFIWDDWKAKLLPATEPFLKTWWIKHVQRYVQIITTFNDHFLTNVVGPLSSHDNGSPWLSTSVHVPHASGGIATKEPDHRCSFHRPCTLKGGRLECRARLQHRGGWEHPRCSNGF